MTTKAIPGATRYNGPHDGAGATCAYLVYDAEGAREHTDVWPLPPEEPGRVDWYDFRGLGDVARAQALAEHLGMPPLALEDAMDVTQRPKFEAFERAALFTIDQLVLTAGGRLTSQKVTLYWTSEYVLTFQEYPDDLFAFVRERIVRGRGRIRQRGAPYLAYALVDNLVDDYTDTLQEFEVLIDRLEDTILDAGARESDVKRRIHRLKAEANRLRSTLGPIRDAVSRWQKTEQGNDDSDIQPFLRDLLDNALRAYALADGYITRVNDLYQLFATELSIRTNKVVQLLTVVSTIFIPLTFLTGLYGMNFEYIPELSVRYGYFVLWTAMLAVTAALLGYFRRKGWF